ncbi:MAG: dicarboxylate/amino acid:cation symporter [Dysgonamonadaceae bacterium]|jgi:Na+/H+-dicarboxylate symporter|nr:dicarboxylate/amino acid:cation symporter [Dysgonamonadaceae bacterium]
MKKHNLFKIPLYFQILIGMILGILVGVLALKVNHTQWINDWLYPWGRLFIRLLQLIAIPLVFVALVKGLIGLKDIHTFSKIGGKTIGLYIITTVIASSLGLGMGLLTKPGAFVDKSQVAHIQAEYREKAAEKEVIAQQTKQEGPLVFLEDIVPNNFISAASNNSKMLQVIFFAMFFGIAALTIKSEKIKPVIDIFDGLNDIILRMVDYIIRFAPYGVAALMAGIVVDFKGDVSIFSALGVYALVIVFSMFIIILVIYPLFIHFFTKIKIRDFLKKMYPVQLFAFTTSSSSATLPVTLNVVEKDLGVSRDTASFILPIGSTINMDGTSCYQTIAVLFIAQVLGIDLSISQLLIVVGMTIISSIGTPGIPGGSFVILTMVLTSVGIPAEGLALILGIDRPLDMLRTSVNVTGDSMVCCLVDKK